MKEPSMIPEHILWVFWHLQAEITSHILRSIQLTFLNSLRYAYIDSEGKIPFWDFTKNFFPHISFFLTCCKTHPPHPPWVITPVILDDWLTVHHNITLVDLQLDAQNSCLFTYNTFIKILYMFRGLPCSSSGGLRRNCVCVCVYIYIYIYQRLHIYNYEADLLRWAR